jgi:UDP-N-acetylenolpyruvoylglucosamine reductase
LLDLKNGKIITLDKNNMDFDYRNSIIKKTEQYFIISAKFDLSILIEKYSSDVDNLYFREYKQPKGNTCGSFFKNPSKEYSA